MITRSSYILRNFTCRIMFNHLCVDAFLIAAVTTSVIIFENIAFLNLCFFSTHAQVFHDIPVICMYVCIYIYTRIHDANRFRRMKTDTINFKM